MEGIQALYLAGKFEQVHLHSSVVIPPLTSSVRTLQLHRLTSRSLLRLRQIPQLHPPNNLSKRVQCCKPR
jgi:hypothetical protein